MRRAPAGARLALSLVLLAGCAPSSAPEQPSTPPATTSAGPAPTPIAGPAPADLKPSAPPQGSAKPSQTSVPLGSGFDFYVLALSWSPSYCEAEGSDANRQQCAAGRPYAFVVHGLWPQFERGFPEDCQTREPDVPQERLKGLYDIMPAAGLIRHEWRTHGSCSGLSQTAYFNVVRKAREAITIPAEFRRLGGYRTVSPEAVEEAFIAANAGLTADAIAVSCDKRYLRDVRFCLTKDLNFRSCPELNRRACRLGGAVMPPVRGG